MGGNEMKSIKLRRSILSLILIMTLVLTFTACGGGSKDTPEINVEGCGIVHDDELHGIFINRAIEDFNAMGFEYGDSVNIEFSNGYKLEDIPYYDGYYSEIRQAFLLGSPEYEALKVLINHGDCLWDVAEVDEGTTCTISMNEKGKYLDSQQYLDLSYSDDRETFQTDEQFANFREVTAGDIQPGRLYRAASACDNSHKRPETVDPLFESAGVNSMLDLTDSMERVEYYMSSVNFASDYFIFLKETGHVYPIELDMDYPSDEFRQKLAEGLSDLAGDEAPYAIFGVEGKDRTGFALMVVESLCGASYEEIREDYMITYENYYGLTRKSDEKRYDFIVENVLDPMIRVMAGDDNLKVNKADLKPLAESYLESAGMTAEEIEELRAKLTA